MVGPYKGTFYGLIMTIYLKNKDVQYEVPYLMILYDVEYFVFMMMIIYNII